MSIPTRNHLPTIAVGTVAVLALTATGCSNTEPGTVDAASPPTSTVSASSDPCADMAGADEYAECSGSQDRGAGPPTSANERGNIVKKIGETAGLGTDVDGVLVRFAIKQIELDPQCSEDKFTVNRHVLRLHVVVTTSPGLTTDDGIDFHPSNFNLIGNDGSTETAMAALCGTDQETLTYQPVRGGSAYRGFINLDEPLSHGFLEFRPSWSAEGSGWEWRF